MVLITLSTENVYSPTGSVPSPSHLTYTPTKSNLHVNISLETVIREPALYKLLMYFVPCLMSIFRRLGCLSKIASRSEAV
jgi:hypothetical protein